MYRSTGLTVSSLLFACALISACGDDEPATTSADRPGAAEDDRDPDGHGGDGHDEASDVAEGARRVEVTAGDFAFDPDEITAEPGEDLVVVLTSEDMLHDFTIDELDAHVAADGGDTAEGGVSADEPGSYTYYCSVPGHRSAGMEGTLTVE